MTALFPLRPREAWGYSLCMRMLSASPHLFTCCVVARTLQAVMVGAVADDGLRQALQEEQQGFGYRMIAKGLWPIVKD